MDQYHGQGGSYLLDPKTGERVLVERTVTAGADAPVQRTRARGFGGKFVADDPATPDVNEAWR